METWIALLRGINVGGRNVVRMADLKADLEALGYRNVATYIQSGNVTLQTDAPPESIAQAISQRVEARCGFLPHVRVLSRRELEEAIEANPFPEATSDGQSLHFFFADAAAKPDEPALAAARAPTERYAIVDHVLYLHAPEGIGRSKIASKADKLMRGPVTARNFSTVTKLHAMVREA